MHTHRMSKFEQTHIFHVDDTFSCILSELSIYDFFFFLGRRRTNEPHQWNRVLTIIYDVDDDDKNDYE